MDFFKIVLIPPMFGALIGFLILLFLGKLRYFDGLSIWASAGTGFLAVMVGLIVGYYVSFKYI